MVAVTEQQQDPTIISEVDLSKRPRLVFNPSDGVWNLPFEGVTGFAITDPQALMKLWQEKALQEGDASEMVQAYEEVAKNTVCDHVREFAKSQGGDPEVANLIDRVVLKPSEPCLEFGTHKVIPWLDFSVHTKGTLTPEQTREIADALFILSNP